MTAPTQSPRLSRNSLGRLVLEDGDGADIVTPVRAFPLNAPREGISLQGGDGRERLWIEHLDHLSDETRLMIEEEFARREFMPVIQALVAVSTFATPSTWTVRTDRGDADFVLRGEEDIRNIGGGRLLITDTHGIQYQIPELAALDRHSRRLLDRFL